MSASSGGSRHPVVMIARGADVATAVFAMKAGAMDFVEKPFRDGEILATVEIALRADRERRAAVDRQGALRMRFETLSPREQQVMALVTTGLLNKQVAYELSLSEVTVKAHRGAAMRKMAARSLAELVRMADTLGAGDRWGAPSEQAA
jgi:FixJ family two-component response regulator